MICGVFNIAIIIFLFIVGLVLGLSFYFASKTKPASNHYIAGGNIHWTVNGIAFAGDDLYASSFFGICGMIAQSGYDRFLYFIGYIAGRVVALFLVAEPLKKAWEMHIYRCTGFPFQLKTYKVCFIDKHADCFANDTRRKCPSYH